MRKLLTVCMCAAVVFAFSLPSLWAADAPKGDLTLKLGGATKPAVVFPHGKHVAMPLDCKACHHKLDSNPNEYKCTSAGCHDSTDPTDKSSPKSAWMAFHKGDSAHSCLGCHKKEKAAGKNPPIACNQCHKQ